MNYSLLAPSCVYGVSWCLTASNHPIYALFWILIAGFIVGVVFGFEGWLKNTIKAALITIAMAIVALIPGFGEIADIIVLIAILLIKINIIRKNFLLIIIGISSYVLLFYWPAQLHHSIAGYSEDSIYNWEDFFIGTSLMLATSYVLLKSGFTVNRIFTFTVGLPGFLFLFNYNANSSD